MGMELRRRRLSRLRREDRRPPLHRTVAALMQPRVPRLSWRELDDLIPRLEQHMRLQAGRTRGPDRHRRVVQRAGIDCGHRI